MKPRMGDLPWNFSEEDMSKLYPELKPEERAEAAENLSQYFKIVGRIYDRLDDEGKLKDTLLRIQYEKRNKYKLASQFVNNKNDDIPTPTEDSNEISS
jgi:DNA-binding TFAR19-related protein (PDSD5 family)